MSDDTIDGRSWKRTRVEEQMLRQFMKLETGLGNSNKFREGWERIFGPKCSRCGEGGVELREVVTNYPDEHEAEKTENLCLTCFSDYGP